ncbi:unnamed protein product [Angiostrongylus costaricensis]|uniref:DUF1338 domain-containing protein n=1 Tax=Angiostrongylus costaricensis TaxID=334426 RepID=A0A0R3P9N4_ANGCS|nr:unnamed protein product [Angiostrongylus costaricensis]
MNSLSFYLYLSKNQFIMKTFMFLYHRVGLTEDDWQYSYYVLRNITFYATKLHCSRIQKSYDDFLKGMGFTYLRRQRDEEIFLNGRYKEVIAYEGELPENVTIKGHHPNLIRGYSSEQKNATYGWELYFERSLNFSLYKKEYWYPEMQSLSPDWDIFSDIPVSCLHSQMIDHL